MNNFNKILALSVLSFSLWSCDSQTYSTETVTGTGKLVSEQVESVTDHLYDLPVKPFSNYSRPDELDNQSCEAANTATVTVYATNKSAQSGIEVKLDGYPIGNINSYYPGSGPGCDGDKTDDGIIKLVVPAGSHTLEASSSNITWPSHDFSVDKCVCMVLPLS